jgi:hypothetical protein
MRDSGAPSEAEHALSARVAAKNAHQRWILGI